MLNPCRSSTRSLASLIEMLILDHRDDLDYLPVLASLPPQQTTFEYLIGCWKRLGASKSALVKKVCLHIFVESSLSLKCNDRRATNLLMLKTRSINWKVYVN